MEVPNEVLSKLVCENCNGYLSRGPVHLMDNVRYRCGRCLPSEEEQGTRIEAYEELAKLMTFPCRYQRNGCTSKVPFAENEAHEEACAYREYICPIAESGHCEWTGIQTQLMEHCRQEHADNVVENPCTFTHNIARSRLQNYLLWTLGVLFLIQTKVCTATRKIYHSVRLIGDPARAANYKYTLCIQNKDSNFSKHREVAPRGHLVLQNDSSIQTDINALLTMLEDFTDTTFTVTVKSTGNGPTTESSTAESSSQGTSSANTQNTTPLQAIETYVECDKCQVLTEPVYRGGWVCRNHAPKRRRCENRCRYSDITDKCVKHERYHCQYSAQCLICSIIIPSTMLDDHYTQVHGDITHWTGTVCTVAPVDFARKYFIIDCDFGRAVCAYNNDTQYPCKLRVYTPLPSDQLYKYYCVIDISHPDTGYTLKYIPTMRYNRVYDWYVSISRACFNMCSQNNKVNIKINISKFG